MQKNLDFLKLNADVGMGDARKIEGEFDAIVTDPPYAKSATTFGADLKDLYGEFIGSAQASTKRGGFLVFSVPSSFRISKGLKVLDRFDIYVHRSLVRTIYVVKIK